MKQTKIETVSRGFKYLFLSALILWIPLHLIVYFGFDGHMNWNGFELKLLREPNVVDFAKLGFGQKLIGIFVSGLIQIFPLYIVFKLTQLFGLFEKGQYFLAQNIKLLKHIGLAMVIAILVDPFHQLLTTATLSIMANPPGQRIMSLTFANAEAYWVVTAVMIYLIAWIMDEGRKLHDEAQHTV